MIISILLIANTFLAILYLYKMFCVWWNDMNPVRIYHPLLGLSLSVFAFLLFSIGGHFALLPSLIMVGAFFIISTIVTVWFHIIYGGE